MMKYNKGCFLILIFIYCSILFAQTGDELLSEIDKWIINDKDKIINYVKECNEYTNKILRGSKYWNKTYEKLSFLMSIDYVSSPQIDNTGRIYFLMRITGEVDSLFYVDSPMSWPHQITPNNWQELGLSIDYYYVHPSGKYILVGVMKHGDENSDVWLFKRDGSSEPLLQDENVRYANIVFNEDDDNEFFLISDSKGKRELLKYNIKTKKVEKLYSEDEYISIVDYKDAQLLCVRWFSFSENQLFILDINTKKTKDITDKSLFWSANFTLDNKVITLTSALSSKYEFMKFATLDLKKPKKLELVYEPKLETDEVLFLRKSNIVIAALNKDGYSSLIGINLEGEIIDIPAIEEIGVITSLSSNDFGEVVFSFSSPKRAPTAFTFRIGDNKIKKVAEVSTFGVDFSNINVEVIRYKSSDNLEIPALLYKPANCKKDGNNPAIIIYHGGPPSQSRPYFQRNIAYALMEGFILLFPNVRGSTGYGPLYQEMDDKEKRFQALIDCERAIDYLVNEGYSAYNKIAIWGASYGGYVVNYLAVKAPEKFAAAISEVGISDIDHTNKYTDVSFQKGWQREFGPIGSELTKRLSPIYYAQEVKRPMFITAGFYDRRVPASDPRRFAYLLKKLGKEVLYYEELEAGHGATTKTQIIELYTKMYVFTQEHVFK